MNKRFAGLLLAGAIIVTGCSNTEIEEVPEKEPTVSKVEQEEFIPDPEPLKDVIVGVATLDDCRRIWGARTNYIEETREHCFRDISGTPVGVQVDVLENVMDLTFEVDLEDRHINREGKKYTDRVGMALATFERHIDPEYHGQAQGEYTDTGVKFTYPNGTTVEVIDTGDLFSELAIKRVIVRR